MGAPGNGDVLTPQQIERIVDAHHEQMKRFGYLPD
jgi:hypothetical protein